MKSKTNSALLFSTSWITPEGMNKTDDILEWVKTLNETVSVKIRKTLMSNTGWFYDAEVGHIVNNNRTFFQISGLRESSKNGFAVLEQPIIIQDEIGYLGMLCKEFDGVLHFLVQAKIEPGNINKVQISPTIQATKSNFTQKHGGTKPAYLDYFLNASRHTIVADQIQSEQSSRFSRKRNRNIIVMLDKYDEVEELPSHKWLTLGQIKRLMKIDNLVNMDTRTVLSCIPFFCYTDGIRTIKSQASDEALLRSIVDGDRPEDLPRIYHHINNYKMFDESKIELVPLYSLNDWENRIQYGVEEFVCKRPHPFKLIFCDIAIDGREVRRWGQPLFEAAGVSMFGLFTAINDGIREFLIKSKPEPGCFDKLELGPSVQTEAHSLEIADDVEKFFLNKFSAKEGILYSVMLSEEGGRFYHEQNLNAVIEVGRDEISPLPPGYFWLTYSTLNKLIQINNCVNIQLRNLLSLLEI